MDGAAFFLQGATALTTNIETWQTLARAHRNNQQETVIITFEGNTSSLYQSSLCKNTCGTDVGGYISFEFQLGIIGKYLNNWTEAPEPYRTLIKLWKDASTTRKDGRTVYTRRRESEGDGRTVMVKGKTLSLSEGENSESEIDDNGDDDGDSRDDDDGEDEENENHHDKIDKN